MNAERRLSMQKQTSLSSPKRAEPTAWDNLILRYPVAAFTACGVLTGIISLLWNGHIANLIFAVVGLIGGVPLIWNTIKNMARGRFYVDTIASVAILGSLGIGEYLAGALVVLMQSGGEALEDYGLRRANHSLDNLLRRAPSVAHLRNGEEYVDIPALDVKVDDLLLIRPGDIIAVDGVVIEGNGSVDEAALTGEPVPLAKGPSDQVYSGTINLNGVFVVRSTSTAAESKYERIVRMVQQAQGERAPINRLANAYTPFLTLVTLTLALFVLLLTHDAVRALSVLVVATPCPLIIATPLAVLSAVNHAAALNIIVKSGAALEQAGAVRSVVFDKTGTLTGGKPSLSAVHCFLNAPPSFDRPEAVLKAAASIEVFCSHVLAGAVVHAARERGIALEKVQEVVETPGSGLSGLINGERVHIGSGTYLRSQGITISAAQSEVRAKLSHEGKTIAYVSVRCQVVGMLVFEDLVRAEAPDTIQRLRNIGIDPIVMLTGDAPETARAVARQVGIEDVRARLHPEEKLLAIRELEARGPVMMVGDGINDAPALASARVGVAMGGYGAGIATDAADVVITVDNVERVADIIGIGRRMVEVAKQGILFGLGASLLLMILAGLGYVRPAAGALLQEVIDLAAILNALRAR